MFYYHRSLTPYILLKLMAGDLIYQMRSRIIYPYQAQIRAMRKQMYNSMDEVPVSLHASIDTGDGDSI